MALWSNTDIEASRPKFLNLANYPAGTKLVFVDTTEASNATNRARGVKSPGWHLFREYLDSNGDMRYKTECIVAMSQTAAAAGDGADDTTVPDVPTVITITTQPTAQTSVLGEAAFTIEATIDPVNTLKYQWQRKKVGSSSYASIAGATGSDLQLTGLTEADSGTAYRCVVSGGGAKAVTSTSAALTFGD